MAQPAVVLCVGDWSDSFGRGDGPHRCSRKRCIVYDITLLGLIGSDTEGGETGVESSLHWSRRGVASRSGSRGPIMYRLLESQLQFPSLALLNVYLRFVVRHRSHDSKHIFQTEEPDATRAHVAAIHAVIYSRVGTSPPSPPSSGRLVNVRCVLLLRELCVTSQRC